MKYVILLILLLTACIVRTPVSDIKYTNVLYIGDSYCATVLDGGKNAQSISGVLSDCLNGRRLVDYSDDLPEYDVIFLALGTNDAKTGVIPERYASKLQTKLESTRARVWCVFPPVRVPFSVDYVRQLMLNLCANTIDPEYYGVYPGADGLHWNSDSHELWSYGIIDVLKLEGIE